MKNKILIYVSVFVYLCSFIFIGTKAFFNIKKEPNQDVEPEPSNNLIIGDDNKTFGLFEKHKVETELDLAVIFNHNNITDSLSYETNDFIINNDFIYYKFSFMDCHSLLYDYYTNSNKNAKKICNELKTYTSSKHPELKFQTYHDYNYLYGMVSDIKGKTYKVFDEFEGSYSSSSMTYQDKKSVYYYRNGKNIKIDKETKIAKDFKEGMIVPKPFSNDDYIYTITGDYGSYKINKIDTTNDNVVSEDKFYFNSKTIRRDRYNSDDYYTVEQGSIYKNNKIYIDKTQINKDVEDVYISDKYIYIVTSNVAKYMNLEYPYDENDYYNTFIVYDKNTKEYVKTIELNDIKESLYKSFMTIKDNKIVIIVEEPNYPEFNSTIKVYEFDMTTEKVEIVNTKNVYDAPGMSDLTNFKDKLAYFTYKVERKEKDEKIMAFSYTKSLAIYNYDTNKIVDIPNVVYYYFNTLENRLYTVELDDNAAASLYYYELTE